VLSRNQVFDSKIDNFDKINVETNKIVLNDRVFSAHLDRLKSLRD